MEQLRVTVLLFLILICICSASMGLNSTCKESERKALLLFKQSFSIHYPYDPLDSWVDHLDSWVGHDCCLWEGVGCDNVTGNVIKLDLGSPYHVGFAGEVNPSLLELKSLRYLDLRYIDFNGSTFPDLFGSMRQLQHLDLSFTQFTGKIPRLLGNLTNLVYLDLRGACFGCGIEGNSLEWAFRLEKLETLYLSWIDLSQALDTLHLLEKLPFLSNLSLYDCSLGNSHQLTTNSNISSTHLQHLNLGKNLFSGPIPLFIQNMSSIQFLSLSSNHLNSSIPAWLDNKVHLRYLYLDNNYFNGSFPHSIQRFSFLTCLDLSSNQFSFSIPYWLANNTFLEYLYLNNNKFNRVDGGVMAIIRSLCRLIRLDLSDNQLQEEVSEPIDNFSTCSIYCLNYLAMRNNNISGYLPIFGSLRSLDTIYLSGNNLEALPPSFGKLSSLSYLDLSYNNFGVFSPVNGSLSSLKTLDLSHNNLQVFPPSLGKLSSLNSIYLSYNNISVVSLATGNLSSLRTLHLSHNNLKTLPPSLRELSSLESLDLSYNNLSVVNQVSLANLSSLTSLDLSSSSNPIILDLSLDWMPPFQLDVMSIQPCKVNGPFPKWVLSQRNLGDLDLSDTEIYRALPHNIGNVMPNLITLRLARNHMNGPIPSSLCGLASLGDLDLQKNRLSGMIPDCWANSQIGGMELSSNRLFGRIPNSLAEVSNLQLLSLSNNSLQGELPLQLSNSATLSILDLGMNDFHGEIPPWNGANFPTMQILILRENRFNGTIPQQLCSFRSLQVIDLARNNFAGTIPVCFGNFPGMGSVRNSSHFIAPSPSPDVWNAGGPAVEPATEISPDEWSAMEVLKGAEREYTTVLHLLVNMDLSFNNLVGAIPAGISNSHLLVGLNLSYNHLNGTIPEEIGTMTSLESFDLSFNNLSGSIPQGLSLLDSLSKLNLSFNNLQGSIPTGRHLQTLNDSSIYMGNPGLCGEPLPKKCFPDDTAHPPTGMIVEDEEDNKHEKMWLYLIIVFGFASGF